MRSPSSSCVFFTAVFYPQVNMILAKHRFFCTIPFWSGLANTTHYHPLSNGPNQRVSTSVSAESAAALGFWDQEGLGS